MKKVYILLICWMLGLASLQGQGLEISLGVDSLRSCGNQIILLETTVSGGVAPYILIWSDGSSADSLLYLPTLGGQWVSATVSDAAGASAKDSVWIHHHEVCVHPGDANGDGLANNEDILALGKVFGAVGPVRPNAHLQWIAQPADPWNQFLPGTQIDVVHSDGNGDGIVSSDDVFAITHNYFSPQTNPGTSTGGAGVPVFVAFPNTNFNPGDTIIAPVMLGTAALPAIDAYGIAFSVQYDAQLFDSGSLKVSFAQSWLGDIGQDLIGLGQDFYQHSQVDVGISRTDQVSRIGYGQIATIIVTVDDIAGKTEGIEMVEFNVTNISLTNREGNPLQVSPQGTQVGIALGVNGGASLTTESWKVYPIPAKNELLIEQEVNRSAQRLAHLRMYDLLGKLWIDQSVDPFHPIWTLSVSQLPRGQYLLQVIDTDGIATTKRVVLSE